MFVSLLSHCLYSPKSRSVILLVDTSQPESLGDRFYESFVYHQEKPSIGFVKKLLLRSVLHCAPPVSEVDTLDLDSKLTVSGKKQFYICAFPFYMQCLYRYT